MAEERLFRLQDRHDKVSGAIEELQTERGIEGEIRDRFVVAREGEREIIIVEDESKPAELSTPEPSFLQKIWNFFTIR